MDFKNASLFRCNLRCAKHRRLLHWMPKVVEVLVPSPFHLDDRDGIVSVVRLEGPWLWGMTGALYRLLLISRITERRLRFSSHPCYCPWGENLNDLSTLSPTAFSRSSALQPPPGRSSLCCCWTACLRWLVRATIREFKVVEQNFLFLYSTQLSLETTPVILPSINCVITLLSEQQIMFSSASKNS